MRRTQVTAPMLGQHGDALVPLWSRVHVHGGQDVAERIADLRRGRAIIDLPQEIREAKAHMKHLVQTGEPGQAYEYVRKLPPDLRAAVKPFYTHFTAGRTTEMATAHSVADLVETLVLGHASVVPAQVMSSGDIDGIDGVCGLLVLTSPSGWSDVVQAPIADDEYEALLSSAAAIKVANSSLLEAGAV